jgi:hypothetical protein
VPVFLVRSSVLSVCTVISYNTQIIRQLVGSGLTIVIVLLVVVTPKTFMTTALQSFSFGLTCRDVVVSLFTFFQCLTHVRGFEVPLLESALPCVLLFTSLQVVCVNHTGLNICKLPTADGV